MAQLLFRLFCPALIGDRTGINGDGRTRIENEEVWDCAGFSLSCECGHEHLLASLPEVCMDSAFLKERFASRVSQ